MRAYDVIEAKRDGRELTFEELNFFIKGYCEGKIPDYQAAALLMAIFLKGMHEKETAYLTGIMACSGDKIDLSEIPGIKVDKHSTGGVGDKITLIIAPLVAACGVPVAKMSGKGLGHTGGTIDKLESIPGFMTMLSQKDFIANVKNIGIAITGQTGNLAPADKKLYSLRDVTATVNNISLIASSIMSKKIASGADKIMLDVKTGSGAFMKTIESSIELANTMVKIGEEVGRKTTAIVTDMDIPLGFAIGNSLEVIEAIETLKGKGPKELEEVSIEVAARMLELAEKGDIVHCRKLVLEALKSGEALRKFSQLVENQGGNIEIINDYSILGSAKYQQDVVSTFEGYVSSIKTDQVGLASMILGAGRETKESNIDYTAGIILKIKKGMLVKKGDLLARLYTNSQGKLEEAEKILKESIDTSETLVTSRPLILALVNIDTIERYV